jgi:hypothetical protein
LFTGRQAEKNMFHQLIPGVSYDYTFLKVNKNQIDVLFHRFDDIGNRADGKNPTCIAFATLFWGEYDQMMKNQVGDRLTVRLKSD